MEVIPPPAPTPPSESFEQLEVNSIQRSLRMLKLDDVEYEVVWNGGEGLTRHDGNSSLKGVCALAIGKLE